MQCSNVLLVETLPIVESALEYWWHWLDVSIGIASNSVTKPRSEQYRVEHSDGSSDRNRCLANMTGAGTIRERVLES